MLKHIIGIWKCMKMEVEREERTRGRREYFLSILVPEHYMKEKKETRYVQVGEMMTLREIDYYTTRFRKKEHIVEELLRTMSVEEKLHVSPRRIMKVYKENDVDMNYILFIGRKGKYQTKYSLDVLTDSDYEMKKFIEENPNELKSMVIKNSCDLDYTKSIVNRYKKTILCKELLEKKLEEYDIPLKDELIDIIMLDVENDTIDEAKLMSTFMIYGMRQDRVYSNAKYIVSKHKRMDGLRKKVKVLEDSMNDEVDAMSETINFAEDMTNNFTKYSSCRKIYFFTKKYMEKKELLLESEPKIKQKKRN